MERLTSLFHPSDGELFSDARPSFAPFDSQDGGHVGVIDVGSNSVRIVIFEGGGRSPAPLYNEKVLCGLGAGLAETGRLNPDGRESARAALGRFARLADAMGVTALAGVATSAMRDAEDGPEFRKLIERETQIHLRVITGEEEARLAAFGVIFGQPDADGVVADLGGASLELCRVTASASGVSTVGAGISLPLGPLRFGKDGKTVLANVSAVAKADIAPLAHRFGVPGGTLYLVGGSWRALARVQMERASYPVPILHEYEMRADEMAATVAWVMDASPKALADINGLSSARAGTLPAAAAILGELIAAAKPDRIAISGFGLREGVCFAQMPAALRSRDPLIEACREQEARRARFPGFGAELGRWLGAFLDPADPAEERLIAATAYLADVNWRTHPDYRSVACVETVTRIHLTGAGHKGRGFLVAALLMRHKGGRKAVEREALTDILDPAMQLRAELAGRAMRLGVALSGAAPGILPDCPLEVDGDVAVLRVPKSAEVLVTGDVEKRLDAVAEPMGLRPRIELR